ncbi:dipeptide-binding ABC transporter [Klebsiella michiganensis]|uniref:Dipeptide-binding ABC transporter n=1 Tax=Klebsiella michiganensis TaxID=1134687 RepID=A0A7H4PQ47_9ENTR|nr:dipeptide-binding ABC transporter [Klebsiella michiganensis]
MAKSIPSKFAKPGFSDGTPLTASDAAFSLIRIRDDEGSLWRDSYSIIAKAESHGTRARLVVTLEIAFSAVFIAAWRCRTLR